jgi:hypothetical protein
VASRMDRRIGRMMVADWSLEIQKIDVNRAISSKEFLVMMKIRATLGV